MSRLFPTRETLHPTGLHGWRYDPRRVVRRRLLYMGRALRQTERAVPVSVFERHEHGRADGHVCGLDGAGSGGFLGTECVAPIDEGFVVHGTGEPWS